VAALAAIGLSQSLQAQQTISGWGADSGDVGGVTITDNGSGNFVASGLPTGNADWRANLPTPITGLAVGQSVTVSGTLAWTAGYMAAGLFRIGLIEYPSLGTLSVGVWSVAPSPTTCYWWGLPTGGGGVSGTISSEIVAKTGGTWFSGNGGGYAVGGANNNASDMTPPSYTFSFTVQNNGGTVGINYSMVKTGSGYTETGSVLDTNGTVPLNFNAIGFFANASDTAFTSPGVTFGSITETISNNPGIIVLGSFQGASDPKNAGWTNVNTGDPITTDTEDSFVAAGVSNCPLSLQVAGNGSGGTVGGAGQPNLELGLSSSQVAAFFTNTWVTFTFSAPAANSESAGYLQMYNFIVNAPGWGFTALPWSLAEAAGNTGNNSSGMPEFNFSSGSPSGVQHQTVSINYSSILSSITGHPTPSYLQLEFQGNSGGGAPDYFWLNNVELSTGPFGTQTAPPPPPKPTLGIQAATPGLRIFAGSGNRSELVTMDENQSWINHSGATYSFTILDDGAQTNYFQTHLFLLPVNFIPTNTAQLGSPYNNNYADYQSSNLVWLQILGTNGASTVTANVSWKTNYANNNPTNVALSITNSTIVGTWTLAFSDNSHGTLTAPGAAPTNFTIADDNVASDFANPLVVYVGVEANSSSAQGCYHDYSQISITGVAGSPEVDNFVTDNSPTINASLWSNNPATAVTTIIPVTTADSLWVNWSPNDPGYGLAVAPALPINQPSGYSYLNYGYNGSNSFVLPQQFNGYNDLPITNLEGAAIWALIPSDCLPSWEFNQGGVYTNILTNAYFGVINPPPAN
jgi:hypothetical protein